MTLTWRDVAGGVRAPELGEATEAITRGILGLGDAVQQLASAPEQRRQAELAQQLMLAGTQGKFLEGNQARSEHTQDRNKKLADDAAMREFGAAQSILEAAARDAAIGGKAFEDFTKSEAYQALSPDARAYGASHLSDAFGQGIGIREQRIDNQRQEQHFQQSMALQRQQEARQVAEHNVRMKELQRAADERKNLDPYRYGAALGDFTQRVSANLFDASGAAYADKSPSQLAKDAGIEDISMATRIFNQQNALRKGLGRDPLPEGVLKTLIAGQAGKNEWFGGAWTTFDESGFDGQLGMLADRYDAAQMEHKLLKDLRGRAKGGEVFTSDLVSQELQRIQPPPRPVVVKAAPMMPDLSNVYAIGRK